MGSQGVKFCAPYPCQCGCMVCGITEGGILCPYHYAGVSAWSVGTQGVEFCAPVSRSTCYVGSQWWNYVPPITMSVQVHGVWNPRRVVGHGILYIYWNTTKNKSSWIPFPVAHGGAMWDG